MIQSTNLFQLFCFVSIVLFLFVSSQDDCTYRSYTLIKYDQLKSCLLSVEDDDLNREKVINTTLGVLEQYAFLETNRDSGSPFNIQVDLRAELLKINATKHDSDFEMHNSINKLLSSLHDPHTMYIKPYCYSLLYIMNPFTIKVTPNEITTLNPIVTISGSNFNNSSVFVSEYLKLTGIDVEPYFGKQIQEIDGMDAWDYIVQEATPNWISKDLSARINEYITHDFSAIPLAYGGIPSSSTFKLKIEDKEIDFEYFGFSVHNQTNTTHFREECYSGIKSYNKKKRNFKNTNLKLEQDRVKYPHLEKRKLHNLISENSPFNSIIEKTGISEEESKINIIYPKESEIEFSVYTTTYPVIGTVDYGIIRIYSFSLQDEAGYEGFKNMIEKSYDYMYENCIRYLILDLRDNGGGSIDLGYQLFYYIFENQKEKLTPKIGNYDLIHSKLHDELFEKCADNDKCYNDKSIPTTPKYWYDKDENQFETIDWYSPGKKYSRGGVEQSYSNLFHENVDLSWENKNKLFFDQEHLILLSDGICGSTCAVFSSKIFQNNLANTVTIGGDADMKNKASLISFPGGQVFDNDIFQLFESYYLYHYDITLENMFDEYPSDQSLSFTWREIYPMDKDPTGENPTPTEFIFYPSDHRINTWDFDNDELIMNKTVYYFPMEPIPSPCPYPSPSPSPTNEKIIAKSKQVKSMEFKLFVSAIVLIALIVFVVVIVWGLKYNHNSKMKTTHQLVFDIDEENEDGFGFELESSSDNFENQEEKILNKKTTNKQNQLLDEENK
ncbi:peptidase s41 family protein [Anaeramoeba flamelloides]|uniref:Peptidase s41 family protein n=1 Tax=Anaeramoeba flamelloides TaxID=1746091 RepID=A0AAV7YHX7_9EUKA|nr:peptidase s41 family protein [Anaeramoeba flamelloides]